MHTLQMGSTVVTEEYLMNPLPVHYIVIMLI